MMTFKFELLHSLLYEAREAPDVYCAIDPSQAREIGQSRLHVAYAARVDRPAISPLLEAFAATAKATGVDLELDAHYRTWLTRIADGQNIPGPTSTIYSRLYQASPQSPSSSVRCYSRPVTVDRAVLRKWESALATQWTQHELLRASFKRSKPDTIVALCGRPGTGRLATAQLNWLSELQEPRSDRFVYFDLRNFDSDDNASQSLLDSARDTLRDKRATIYFDFTAPLDIDAKLNDALASAAYDATEPLDLLQLLGDLPSSTNLTRCDPYPTGGGWRGRPDVPRAFGPNSVHYGEMPDEFLAHWFAPGMWHAVAGWERDSIRSLGTSASHVVALSPSRQRLRRMIELLARETGRPVLWIADGREQDIQERLRGFILQHRLGIVAFEDGAVLARNLLRTGGSQTWRTHSTLAGEFLCHLEECPPEDHEERWSPRIGLESSLLENIWVFAIVELESGPPWREVPPSLFNASAWHKDWEAVLTRARDQDREFLRSLSDTICWSPIFVPE